MRNQILDNYENSLQDLYDHVGFVEDWVVCPIEYALDMYWQVQMGSDGRPESVRYAKTIDDFLDENAGNFYNDDIYTQRFYNKWVYEGEDFTMIFCDPHVDGMKWFKIFETKKKLTTENLREYNISKVIE